MKGIITASTAIVAIVATTLLYYNPKMIYEPQLYPKHVEPIKNPEQAVKKFAKSLSFPTVSMLGAPLNVQDGASFESFHRHLESSFPNLYASLKVTRINTYSLLATWEGTEPSLKPIIMISHIDVVPAFQSHHHGSPSSPYTYDASLTNWTYPPFSGTVADGYIWGRGALDTKVSLFAMFEAVSQLLDNGGVTRPRRTIYFAFGHDEEVGGTQGAAKIAEYLWRTHGIEEVEMILDECGFINTDGLRAGKNKDISLLADESIEIAVVGMATKGSATYTIQIRGEGGHSSIPPTGLGTSVAARISRIIHRIETIQTSTRLVSPTVEFLQALAPFLRWSTLRQIFSMANNRILNPILGQILGQIAGSRELSAMVRTTVAPVAITATSQAHNVMPTEGNIRVNFRILPGESDVSSIEEYLGTIIQQPGSENNKDSQQRWPLAITYSADPGSLSSPSKVTAANGPNWELLSRSIIETMKRDGKKIIVVPYLCMGGTDALHYENIDKRGVAMRFNPLRLSLSKGDTSRIHGVDERVGVEDYLDAVRFYMRFLKLSAGDADVAEEE